MSGMFQRHYTKEEAEALLPQVRVWFTEIDELRHGMREMNEALSAQQADGSDLGGETVNRSLRAQARIQTLLDEFQSREIQVKDLDRWLIDFPALIGGREVLLCWKRGEEAIEYWHDLHSGYAGRTPL